MVAAGARQRFAERLTALFRIAGSPTIKSVVRRANTRSIPGASPVTVQRISDWRRGNRVPATFESVLPALSVLIADAKERAQAETVDTTLLDLGRWRIAWQQAKNDQGVLALRVREPDHPPYRGLSSYRAEDADLYFGRDTAREAVLEAIATVERDGEIPRLVLVVGVSGAGKSSLLAAGLQANPQARAPILLSPGARPSDTLRAALGRVRGDRDTLLLIDQGEELFTLCENGADRRAFVDELRHRTAPDAARPVTAVLAIRSDFFNDLIQYPLLARAMKDASVIVGAMTEAELRDAVVGPALACGLKAEPALVDVILRDLDAATSDDGKAALLPLLSHVLEATWSRRQGRTLTLQAYRDAGGMAGSVAATAERAWSGLTDDEKRFARAILMTLTVVGPRSVTRNRVSHRAIVDESTDPALTETVIARLVDARLVMVHDGELELLHDAVPRVWPRMAEWVSEEKEFGPARHRIEEDARAWSAEGQPAELLYDAKRLETVDVVTGSGGSINRIAREFVAESARRQRELSTRRRMTRAAAALLVVAVLVAAVLVIIQRHTVLRERTDAEVTALIRESQRTESFDPVVSTRMALAAYRIRPNDPETQARLLSTQSGPVIHASAERHAGKISGLAYHAAHRLLASAGDDARVRLWSLTGDVFAAVGDGLRGHSRSVTSVAFAPDGGVLASASYDDTVRLWDVRDPKHPRALGVLNVSAPALSIVYATDGRSIIVGCEDGGLTLIDVADPAAPRPIERIPAHADAIRALAVSLDGTMVASGGDDHTIRIWSIAEPGRIGPLGAPLTTGNAVHALAFGEDDHLAVGTASGTVRMWTLADRAAPREFGLPQTLHYAAVDALLFGPGGQMASGSADGTVCLWQQTAAGFQPFGRPVGGNRGAVSALQLAVLADDAHLISAGADGRVRFWTRPSADIPVATDTPFTSMDLDHSGTHMVTGGADGRFQVWTVTRDRIAPAGEARADLPPYHGARVEIRPDGAVLAAADTEGGGVQLWGLRDPARPVPLGGPLPLRTRYFAGTGFTPDGKVLVTGDDDFSIRLWDIADPAHPRPLGTAAADTTRSFRSLAISPDGTLVAAGAGDAAIYLWDIGDPHRPVLRARLTGHEGPVSALVFAADGRHLFSGGDDESIRSWDVGDLSGGRAPSTVVRTASATDLSIDGSGRRLVSAGVDQTVRLWDIGDPARPIPLGSSISTDIGSRWFVRFDRTGGHRVLGIADWASERWITDPAEVAAQLCRTSVVGPDPGSAADSAVSLADIDLCPK
ncbi:hypothetical protein [Nocardia terpenica]|uniref:nSTAND1 domain-containing NTPase n=1 Tax=Nocardia terpenica TaxID=455432 RepID=UPI000A51B3F0|nr:hypothetical protein [Nocardia terpenica]NQE92943.1 hypothetical protein [Nocardia terpenica]